MKKSAGILLYKKMNDKIEFLLVHPGGPYFAKKDEGVWSIPKGEYEVTESPLEAAIREFKEETGYDVNGAFTELNPVKLKSGKEVHAWAAKGDLDCEGIVSNSFKMEWPPKSGKIKEFPEIDRAGWFSPEESRRKINLSQFSFIEQVLVIEKILG